MNNPMIESLQFLGITYDDAVSLRRISMTLHRWYEDECGNSDEYCSWSIERDETTDKPYRVIYPYTSTKSRRYPIRDMEKGDIKRLDKIMANYPALAYYLQTDPRGASLFIYKRGDLGPGMSIDSCYSSIGRAVHK